MTVSPAVSPGTTPRPAVGDARAASSVDGRPRVSLGIVIGVALGHAGLLGLLWTGTETAAPPAPPRPLIVSLVAPPIEPAPPPARTEPEPRPPEPLPTPQITRPLPKPQPPKPVPEPLPKPVLTAEPAPRPQPMVERSAPATPPAPAVPLPEPAPELLPAPAPLAEAPRPAPPAPPAPTPPRPADYLDNPKPLYPALSKRLGEAGTVRLKVLVNPDGSVARLELAKSSGHPRLDRSAMDTVQSSWKFEPARQGDTPVAAWVIVPIQFTLRS